MLVSFAGKIVFDPLYPEQLSVVYNNKILQYGTDYTITATSVVLSGILPVGQSLIVSRNASHTVDRKVYYSIGADSQTGVGNGATFTIDNTRGVYNPTLASDGSNYAIGDTLTFYGTSIQTDNSLPNAYTNPGNNLVITVTGVSLSGAIETFTSAGTGVQNNYIFPLNPYLYGVNSIWDISVTVNGTLQRPFIDYDYNTDSTYANDLVFNSPPLPGALIEVNADTKFNFYRSLMCMFFALYSFENTVNNLWKTNFSISPKEAINNSSNAIAAIKRSWGAGLISALQQLLAGLLRLLWQLPGWPV